MSHQERVCAVVVTFNRRNLLQDCLNGLLNQTRPLDGLVVVNNASTDETVEMLAAHFPSLTVLNLPSNTGGAGGFHTGMKWAFDNGFDWMWVMDDDVEPLPDGLETMLGYSGLSQFIHARKRFGEEEFAWEGVWDMSLLEKRCYAQDISFQQGREWISVNYSNFEGALINRGVIDKIGLPDPKFFIWGDDTVYGFLASQHTNVIYINRFALIKKLPGNLRLDERKIYFQFRNRFLLYAYLQAAGVPLSRSAFWLHNLLSITWIIRRQTHLNLLRRLRSITWGLRDGMQERFGRPAWL
jgi:rhamnopyranosyl-N-acetylglucosaminyl-diphospho-decaprenol beta-1,3/1,4-galactofuranosyltransferase